jgi:hypothetical protein
MRFNVHPFGDCLKAVEGVQYDWTRFNLARSLRIKPQTPFEYFQAGESLFHRAVAKRRLNTPRKQRMWQQAGNSQAAAWAKCRARERAGNLLPDSLHRPERGFVVSGSKSETTDRRGLVPTQEAKAFPRGSYCLLLTPSLQGSVPKSEGKERAVEGTELQETEL